MGELARSGADIRLASPLPVVLPKDEGTVQLVMGITASHPMPRVLAVQLCNLIEEVASLVEAMTQPVGERLEQTLAGTDGHDRGLADAAGSSSPRRGLHGVKSSHAAPTGVPLLAYGTHRQLTDALPSRRRGSETFSVLNAAV